MRHYTGCSSDRRCDAHWYVITIMYVSILTQMQILVQCSPPTRSPVESQLPDVYHVSHRNALLFQTYPQKNYKLGCGNLVNKITKYPKTLKNNKLYTPSLVWTECHHPMSVEISVLFSFHVISKKMCPTFCLKASFFSVKKKKLNILSGWKTTVRGYSII